MDSFRSIMGKMSCKAGRFLAVKEHLWTKHLLFD